MTRVRLAMDIVSFERCFIWYQVEVLGDVLTLFDDDEVYIYIYTLVWIKEKCVTHS